MKVSIEDKFSLIDLLLVADPPRPDGPVINGTSKLLIPVENSAVLIAEAEPDKVVMVEASMIPMVLPSRVFNSEASMEVSEMVIDSLPNPLIPDEE